MQPAACYRWRLVLALVLVLVGVLALEPGAGVGAPPPGSHPKHDGVASTLATPFHFSPAAQRYFRALASRRPL